MLAQTQQYLRPPPLGPIPMKIYGKFSHAGQAAFMAVLGLQSLHANAYLGFVTKSG